MGIARLYPDGTVKFNKEEKDLKSGLKKDFSTSIGAKTVTKITLLETEDAKEGHSFSFDRDFPEEALSE